MHEGAQYNPQTVEEVFGDFKGHQAGMIKALTTDVEEFYQQCDAEKENLCLYRFPRYSEVSSTTRNPTMIFFAASNREFVTVDLVLSLPPPQLPPLIKLAILDKWLSKLEKMRILLSVTSFDVFRLLTICCAVVISRLPLLIVVVMVSSV
ncbi:Alfin, N-terminal [Dillenia turbinata]|uniref:PHD finger protein ALFIN-LIKE n=1 Tax=Dillenia turbinata TaxID=194707 RepID=A0AAN8ZHY1_9MAGN